MNSKELVSQLEFLRDIGVDSLSVQAPPIESNPEPSIMTLESIRAELGDCQRCKLAPKRTNIVFGSGNPNAELVFVGEAPGFDEDNRA